MNEIVVGQNVYIVRMADTRKNFQQEIAFERSVHRAMWCCERYYRCLLDLKDNQTEVSFVAAVAIQFFFGT